MKDGWLIRLAITMGRPYGSVSSVGSKLGLGDKRRSAPNSRHIYTAYQREAIIKAYQLNRGKRGDWLDRLAKELGRDKHNISRFARLLGLTQKSRKWLGTIHPRGMLGKTHSMELKRRTSSRFKKLWKDPTSKFNSKEFRAKRSAISSRNMSIRLHRRPESVYSRVKHGWLEFERGRKRYFFRSGWEMTYAKHLDLMKRRGKIRDWWYEVDTFWFDRIKRGVRSYTPDFRIECSSGEVVYHEVKGWMDQKSKTKMKRMAKYHPQVKLKVIGPKEYKEISELEVYPLE